MPDIDIDFRDRTQVLDKIKHVPASLDNIKKHNTGVYPHSIPVNPLTGMANIDYKHAEDRGYFKIDFLNVSAYEGVKNEEHLVKLLETEPEWDLLHEKDVCDQLFHVNGYHHLIADLNPRSILELAMVLAIVRPGKKHLIPICKEKGFKEIEDEIWTRTEEYYFKKAHAVAYAHVVVVQLNLWCESLLLGASN